MKMRIKSALFAVITCVVTLAFLLTVEGSQEFPITTQESDQKYPAVCGEYVVWQDNRNGNWDIYGYNLTTQKEFQITTHPADQTHPAIHNNMVVWEDHRCFEGEGDSCWFSLPYAIYGYNLATGEEFQVITTPEWRSSFAEKSNPVIYNDTVVWEDRSVGQPPAVIGITLSTRETFQVGESSAEQRYPAIYGDSVVWLDEREPYTYGYNISTKEEFQIGPEHRFLFQSRGGYFPAIYGDMVIWLETYDGIIYGYNLSEEKEILIGTASMGECHLISSGRETTRPTIYKDYVIWVDCRNGNPDIFGYNLSEKEEFQIIVQEDYQLSPALYETTLVWQDNRNGNWDIYGCYLTPPFIQTSFKSRTWVILDTIRALEFWALLIGIPGVILAIIAFSAGKSIWYRKKVTPTSEAPLPKILKRNALFPAAFLLAAGASAFLVYSSVIDLEFLTAFLNSGICAFFLICYVWARRTPNIRITDDQIVLFKGKTKPRMINIDAVKNVYVRKWINILYRVDVLLSDDTEEKIPIFFLNEKDKEELIKTLNKYSCVDRKD